jgi:hypothetical protein
MLNDNDIDITNDDADADASSSATDSGRSDKKPFAMRGYLVQEELAKGEKKFGEIDWSRRETEPPLEETQQKNYSEEQSLAAANDNIAEQHPFLACQQFDGRDPKRDQRIPSVNDLIAYADSHPEAQLVLNPQLRLALENAKRNQYNATPTLKPAGM